jgi:hypothetical protein
MTPPLPRKQLPINPSLEHLQKQAKRRVKQTPGLQLAAAQQQIALEFGCKNWAQLAQVVETMARRLDVLPREGERYRPMPKAARARDVDVVRAILAAGAYTPLDLDQSLAHALWYGDDSNWPERKVLADLLLDHGADPDGQYGSGGSGPIVFGTGECVRVDGLQYLIEAGADLTFAPIQTKYGMNCPLSGILGTYVRGKNEAKHRYIDLLLQQRPYVPPNVTPPVLAIHRGDAAQLAELIAADQTLIARRFPEMPYGNMELKGAGLLHCAVELGERECVEVLLNRGADLNLRAEMIGGVGGQTPIFHGIASNREGNFPTLEYLVHRAGRAIDLTVCATWRRHGETPTQPMTPLEFAEHAARTEDPQWRTKAAEERALLQSIA